ncbi:hypothetical protein MNEG_5212 [Monoraphidium neglectum]|uniref:Uncharacterized protein n=1 Tax=Monoraphidium neglectum TaxID=145388 RepID=A0A0D2NB82_9CHLO|nr:hypothetical protein MNEG_5212 [Monoraphidium neglectum]KIZ02746.1 hypothetical protein MNEG_5212 [Monoraphidium neglectum]|eukprot:XP_013901765.1 hypothetical protein MNEG_5212 [Monoraphidium neglectum]
MMAMTAWNRCAAASAACAAPAPAFGAARWWSSAGDAGGEGSGQRRGKCAEGRASPDDEPQLFIRQLQEAGEQGDLARVFDLVEGRGEDIDEEGVEVALAQVAHCSQLMKLVGDQLESEVHHKQTFQTLVDMAAHGAKRFSAPAKARIVSLLGGQLKWRDEVALDELGRSLMAGVQDLGPTHLSLLVGGLAAAGHSPGVLLLDAVRDRIRELGPSEVPAQQG